MSTRKDKFSFSDTLFMKIALDLAKNRRGHTGINPSVGCVITKNEKIISIGQTAIGGRPHAEYNAINNSVDDLSGAKMYVTLEPCCHQGVTAPCTKEIIKSKISEVIYSVKDIDKRVRGKTDKILRAKNIKVKSGLLREKANHFYSSYFYNRRYKLPYITGKIAISKNNLIYSKNHKKITSELSNNFTHYLRYINDSILISYKTLNKDNPRLDCRLKNLKKFSPKRIILDNRLELSTKSYLFKSANKNNTIIFYNEGSKLRINKFKKNKINLIKSKINKDKKFDLKVIMKKLYRIGTRNILIEGGNDLTINLLKKKIFNIFYLFKSSKKIPKVNEYKEFKGQKMLKQSFRIQTKLKSNFGKDTVVLYKN